MAVKNGLLALFLLVFCAGASAPPAPPITLEELADMRWISYAEKWWPVRFSPSSRDYVCVCHINDSTSWQGSWVSYQPRTATLVVEEAVCVVKPDDVPSLGPSSQVTFVFSKRDGFIHAQVRGGSWGTVEAWLRP